LDRSELPHKIDLFKSSTYIEIVKKQSIRTSIDLPRHLHRKLHEAAARQGCSARQLILRGIERAIEEPAPRQARRRLALDTPIVPSRGKPFSLTNEEIYELIELP
jgi:hypothetical protein